MARVNVEEELFAGSKIRKLGKLLGGEHIALGYLVFLWRDSQESLRVSGKKEELVDWCRVKSSREGEKVFAALLDVGFITDMGDGEYLIEGNKSQIDGRVKRLRGSAKGAAATRERWEKMKAQGIAQGSASTGLEASPHHGSTTPSSGQFSSVQGSSVQSIAPSGAKPEQVEDCVKAWEQTLEHFKIVRPIQPKEQGVISQLLRENGYPAALYALTGMRFEESTGTFDPKKNVSIFRALDPKLFSKFMNLAAQKRNH